MLLVDSKSVDLPASGLKVSFIVCSAYPIDELFMVQSKCALLSLQPSVLVLITSQT